MKLAAKLFAVLLALLMAQTASAQSTYPNRAVKILVGFTPGTAPDLAARILADRFSEIWGSPFVVENIPSAGSNVATESPGRNGQLDQRMQSLDRDLAALRRNNQIHRMR